MKRKLTLLLACLMALTMALTGAAESLSPVGSWTLTGVEMQGMTLDPAMLGMEITMTLNEDGTAEMGMSGLVEEGTWSMDGDTVTMLDANGDTMTLTLAEDGTLRGEDDGVGMIFTHSGEAAPIANEMVAPEGALEDVALADFNGEWTSTRAVVMGQEVPMEQIGQQMDANIQDGSVTITTTDGSGTIQAALDGNALIVDNAGVQMPFYLLEDGTMSMSLDIGVTIQYIFERVA